MGGGVAPVTFTDEVVALTLTPQRGLKFATKYRLTFSTLIVDTDLSPTGQPDPKPLDSQTNFIEFETFRPTKLGEAPLQGNLVAMTTLDDLAFVALQPPEANGLAGNLQVFDLSDPTQPTKVGEDSLFIGSMVRDVDVEKEADGSSDVLGVLSFNPRSGNSGLTLFDVTSRQSPFPYAGFVTTVVPGEGADFQVDLHGGFAYVAIGTGGLKIVNLSEANEFFRAKLPDQTTPPIGLGSIPFEVQRGLSTRGVGFGQQAVQNHLQIPDTSGSLRVSAIQVEGSDLDRVGYAGSLSDIDHVGRFTTIGLANSPAASILATVELKTLPDPEGNAVHMGLPSDIAVTDIGADKYAVVVGAPMAQNGRGTLAILKVTESNAPQLLTVIELRGGWGTNLVIDEDGVTVFVSTSDRRDGDITIPGGVEIYNLSNPAAPLFAGKMEDLGEASGGLAIRGGILTGTDVMRGIHAATIGPAIPVLNVEPRFISINRDGQTEDDFVLRYQILPTSRGVLSVTLDIKDELGATLFSSAVPVVDRGELVWPKGQPVKATPRRVVFEVRNPDGGISNAALAGPASTFLPPFIIELSPSEVSAGSGDVAMSIGGVNFVAGSRVQISRVGGQPTLIEVESLTSTHIELTIPMVHFVNSGTMLAEVVSSGLKSNTVGMNIVAADVPTAPTLVSLEPDEVTVGAPSFWLTIDGFNFVEGESVARLDMAGDPLVTAFVSTQELRALVPASYLLNPGRISVTVGPRNHPDVQSVPGDLKVLSVFGDPLPPIGPSINIVSPPKIPYLSPDGSDTQSIRILGEGFQPAATAFATVDDAEPALLLTEVISSQEIEVKLSRALWSKHSLFFALTAVTASSTASTAVQRDDESIEVTLLDQNGNILGDKNVIEPSIFHDRTLGYLVDEKTGKRSGNLTFEDNPTAFHIRLRDPYRPSTTEVTLESNFIGGSFAAGVTLRDSIENVTMVSGSVPGTLEMDHRIVAVTDQVDDARDSKGNNFSGKADGKDDDPTILVRPGSDLRVTYRGDGRERRSSAVAVCRDRRKVNLHLVNSTDPNAGPDHKWETAEIDRVVKDASGIWAQLCVDLVVIDHNGSKVVQAPSTNIPLGPIASSNSQGYDQAGNPISGTGIVSVGVELTQSAKQVIDALPLNPGGSPNVAHDDVRVYLVDQLTAGGATISGVAVTQSHYFKQVQNVPAAQLDPERSEFVGAVLLAKDAGEVVVGGNKTRFSANGKTFAHEIAHLVFDQGKAQPPDPSATPPLGAAGFSGPPVNILDDQSEFDVESLLKKRFDSDQRARRSKFLKPW